MKFKKNSVTIQGRTFFYWEKNTLKKEVILLLHGFPGNHLGLVPMADFFGDDWRIIIPDLPACGQSEDLKGIHHVKNYSDWLNAFLESLSIESTIIIGHSFGARLALVFGADYPQKVRKLALITPVVEVDGFIARLAATYYRIAGILPVYFQKMMISSGFTKKVGNMIILKTADTKLRKAIIARDIKELKKLNHKVVIELFDEFYMSELMGQASKIAVTSLIIAGGQDEVATPRSVQMLAERMKNNTFEIIGGAGHLVPLEEPRTVAEIIKPWLQNNRPVA